MLKPSAARQLTEKQVELKANNALNIINEHKRNKTELGLLFNLICSEIWNRISDGKFDVDIPLEKLQIYDSDVQNDSLLDTITDLLDDVGYDIVIGTRVHDPNDSTQFLLIDWY